MTQQELGQRIADARRARRWIQGELAERVGLDQTAVSRIETGARAVGSLELAELAEALEVSVLDLLRAGQRPMLAIAAQLGHFRDPGAVDRALRRAGTLIGLGELLESLLEAAPAGPARRGWGSLVGARPSSRASGWPGRFGRLWASGTDRWRASPSSWRSGSRWTWTFRHFRRRSTASASGSGAAP